MCQAHRCIRPEPDSEDPDGSPGPPGRKGKMYPGDQVAGTKKPRLIKNRGPVDSMTYSGLRCTSQRVGVIGYSPHSHGVSFQN